MSGTWIIVTPASRVDGLVARAGAGFSAVVVGPRELADRVAAGAATTLHVAPAADVAPEAYATAVATALAEQAPDVVVTGMAPAERVLLGAVAGKLAAPVFTAVKSFSVEGGTATVTYAALGGIVEETAKVAGTACLIVDTAGSYPAPAGGTGTITDLGGEAGPIAVAGTQTSGEAQVDLAAASKVVGVGRGLKAEADLAMINELAGLLGAPVACSRPLAEGLNWLPKERYIGVSGLHLKPALYVAAGISGQLQHMVGIREAGTIVSFEQNEKAPIVEQSDYTLLGDMYQLIPAVIAELKK